MFLLQLSLENVKGENNLPQPLEGVMSASPLPSYTHKKTTDTPLITQIRHWHGAPAYALLVLRKKTHTYAASLAPLSSPFLRPELNGNIHGLLR